MFKMEVDKFLSHSLYALPVGGVLILAVLVFAFGFKTVAEPTFDKSPTSEDKKKKQVKPKTKVMWCISSFLVDAVAPSSNPFRWRKSLLMDLLLLMLEKPKRRAQLHNQNLLLRPLLQRLLLLPRKSHLKRQLKLINQRQLRWKLQKLKRKVENRKRKNPSQWTLMTVGKTTNSIQDMIVNLTCLLIFRRMGRSNDEEEEADRQY